MSIIKYLDLFIGSVINMILCIYIIYRVFKVKINNSKTTIFFSLFLVSIALSIINVFNKDFFKLLFTFPFVVILIKKSFTVNYNKAIDYVIFATLYMFAGEVVLALICSLLPFDYSFIFNNMLGTTIGAIIVAIFTLILLKINLINNKVYNLEKNLDEKTDIFIVIFIIMIIGSLLYKISNSNTTIINILMNVTITVTFILIIYMYFKENVKSLELSKKYNELFNYLEKYEKELVEKRKIIHDYKNQLIVINGYIGDDNKLREYIQELIEEQKIISENSIIKNIDKLPKGLKGLIYYKLSHVNKQMKVYLEIKGSIKKFEKINSKLNKDVLTIIGVLIDNAIEATEIENEKYINIEFSIVKGLFIMKMINPCSKNIKISNIINSGFSTKGNNRGYGLPMVKDILNRQKDIYLNLEVVDNKFISELKVNIK